MSLSSAKNTTADRIEPVRDSKSLQPLRLTRATPTRLAGRGEGADLLDSISVMTLSFLSSIYVKLLKYQSL